MTQTSHITTRECIAIAICRRSETYEQLVDRLKNAPEGSFVLRVTQERVIRGKRTITAGNLWSSDREKLRTALRLYGSNAAIHQTSPDAPYMMAKVWGQPLHRMLQNRINP